MSDTESSSTSILVAQINEEDTENDTEIDEIPVKKARKASRESSVCSCPDWDKNLICKHVIGVAYRRKQATTALVQRISTGPINPALQSFNYKFPISMARSINQDPLSNENDNDQDQAESINNDIQTIVQPTTSSNLAPRKRGRPRKNP
ncbi:hypothetical protein BpHYR1_032604 [Brachionus plicatilis]|uniref:SWIM-type domain-containing protein n=1 Tax=Brachionus plicatilis TaxID=10195 RepID=A0A3M7QYN8_BRAPC|nr:hypothetical protein BpHYR1_032604 [Brachionus plicatilis]